jgi:hypothetical protein
MNPKYDTAKALNTLAGLAHVDPNRRDAAMHDLFMVLHQTLREARLDAQLADEGVELRYTKVTRGPMPGESQSTTYTFTVIPDLTGQIVIRDGLGKDVTPDRVRVLAYDPVSDTIKSAQGDEDGLNVLVGALRALLP